MELKIDNLSKTYANGVQALKNVSLDIPQGMFGLLGPNGAGKSTLMRTIATLQDADEGAISLGEIDVLKQKDDVRKFLGYLPQAGQNPPNDSRFKKPGRWFPAVTAVHHEIYNIAVNRFCQIKINNKKTRDR